MRTVLPHRWLTARLRFTKNLDPGFWNLFTKCFCGDLLIQSGFRVERQKPIPIHFHGKRFDEGFRADLVVGGTVLVELKSVEFLARVHKKQVLTYLELSHLNLDY